MTYLFWNLKGGVGKSSLATHFFLWARVHKRFCFLDADEQSTAMKWIAGNRYDGHRLIEVDGDGGPVGSIATSDPRKAKDYDELIIDGTPRSDFLEALSREIDLQEGWHAIVPVGERYSIEGALEAIPRITDQGGRPLIVVNAVDRTTAIGQRTIEQAKEVATHLGAELHRRIIPFSKVFHQAADKGAPAWNTGWARNSHAVLALNLFCHELLFGEPSDGTEYDYTYHQRSIMNDLRIN